MALSKTIIQDNGVETSYHKVTEVYLRVEDNGKLMLMIRLESYLDREYRDKNKPISFKNYNIFLSSDEAENLSIRQYAYSKLKELPEWADAVDC